MLKPNEGKRPHLLSNWTFQTGASGHHRWGQFTSTRCYWSELAKWLILHAAPRMSEQASSPFYFVKFTAQQSKPAITASNIKKKKKHKSRPFSSCSEVTSFWPPLHGTFLCGEERWCGSCGGKPSSFCSSASHGPLHAQRCWQEVVAPSGTSPLVCHNSSCSRIVPTLTHSSCGNASPCSGTALVAAALPSGLFPLLYQLSQEGIVTSTWKAPTVMAAFSPSMKCYMPP